MWKMKIKKKKKNVYIYKGFIDKTKNIDMLKKDF